MIKFPLVLKQSSDYAGYYMDGWRNHYSLGTDGYFYPVDPITDKKFTTICISPDYVKILTADHRQLLNVEQATGSVSFSIDQRHKGIGIIDDEEKAHTVVTNGDCSDGGNQESVAMKMQKRMERNALTAGEGG